MIEPRNPELAPYLRPRYDRTSIAALTALLDRRGTLAMEPLGSGLFSASLTTDFSKGTNYRAAWVRDNVHVAYAHFAAGRPEVARRTAEALCAFFATQRGRFRAIIDDTTRRVKSDRMRRPHIRFDGDSLAELDQPWSHAQNDALGYFLWLYATLAVERVFRPSRRDLETLALFPDYFRAIEYWKDEDSGHWEEVPKVSASSIGAVVAGLRRLRALASSGPGRGAEAAADPGPLDELIANGESALGEILPAECIQPAPLGRPCDAALLFLVYPLDAVDRKTADEIIARTEAHLRGDVGIRRYLGDSFYCTDYEHKMAARDDDPTRDFSADVGDRDKLLRPGDAEAQWCLFDPTLSVIYGLRHHQDGNPDDLRKQTEYLNRSLAQVSRADPPRCEAFRCPELYYHEQGKLQTSKSTPLLWTQANLWTALEAMRRSVELQAGRPDGL